MFYKSGYELWMNTTCLWNPSECREEFNRKVWCVWKLAKRFQGQILRKRYVEKTSFKDEFLKMSFDTKAEEWERSSCNFPCWLIHKYQMRHHLAKLLMNLGEIYRCKDKLFNTFSFQSSPKNLQWKWNLPKLSQLTGAWNSSVCFCRQYRLYFFIGGFYLTGRL